MMTPEMMTPEMTMPETTIAEMTMMTGLSRVTRHIIQPGSALIMLAWPLLIWFGIQHGVMGWIVPVMLLLLVLRLGLWRNASPMAGVARGMVLVACLFCVLSLLLKQQRLLLYYPVLVNLVLFSWFFASLFSTMPLIERVARWRNASLPDEAVRYTRRVTQVWCGFFVVNGAMALATCLYGNLALWAAWNGLLSYCGIGALMAGEWLVRQWVIRRMTS